MSMNIRNATPADAPELIAKMRQNDGQLYREFSIFDFDLDLPGLLNAFSDLQNGEYSMTPSHISDFRKSPSENYYIDSPNTRPNDFFHEFHSIWTAYTNTF